MAQNDGGFVSRGGLKLQEALDKFQINVSGKTVLDVGSSTGGFVDCLLQNGAQKVYALDTSYGELAWKLRNDPRVAVMERTNILYLEKLPDSVIARRESTKQSGLEIATLPMVARNDEQKVDLVTIDAGWTKLELVLPIIRQFLKADGLVIALLKPQYEAEKKDLVKGVVKEELVEEIKNQVIKKIQDLGFLIKDQVESPILGGGGNKEYLVLISNG